MSINNNDNITNNSTFSTTELNFDDEPFELNTPLDSPNVLYHNNKSSYSDREIITDNDKLREKRKKKILSICIYILLSTFYVINKYGLFNFTSSFAHPISASDKKNYIAIHTEAQRKIQQSNTTQISSNLVTYKVSSYDEFMSKLHTALINRKEKINISYQGSDYQNIISLLETPEDDDSTCKLLEQLYAIDDSSTANDADYIRGNLRSIYKSCTYGGTICNFKFEITWIENATQLSCVDTYTNYVISALNLNSYSDEEKISIVHDFITTNLSYDTESVDNDEDLLKHSAYKGVMENKTVCSGYALLNYKILTEVGVPCKYVTSKTHGWNLVKLNNKWYHLDLTWDDNNDVINRRFYLKGDKDWNNHSEHITKSEYKTSEFLDYSIISETDF